MESWNFTLVRDVEIISSKPHPGEAVGQKSFGSGESAVG